MPNITVLSRLIRQLHRWIIGNGLMIHGHGRKGDANLCGIMRNDYNILLRLLRLTRNCQIILTQFGGPDGELAASMRYLAQRYTMPYKEVTGILTDIGTEESVQKWYQLFIL